MAIEGEVFTKERTSQRNVIEIDFGWDASPIQYSFVAWRWMFGKRNTERQSEKTNLITFENIISTNNIHLSIYPHFSHFVFHCIRRLFRAHFLVVWIFHTKTAMFVWKSALHMYPHPIGSRVAIVVEGKARNRTQWEQATKENNNKNKTRKTHSKYLSCKKDENNRAAAFFCLSSPVSPFNNVVIVSRFRFKSFSLSLFSLFSLHFFVSNATYWFPSFMAEKK